MVQPSVRITRQRRDDRRKLLHLREHLPHADCANEAQMRSYLLMAARFAESAQRAYEEEAAESKMARTYSKQAAQLEGTRPIDEAAMEGLVWANVSTYPLMMPPEVDESPCSDDATPQASAQPRGTTLTPSANKSSLPEATPLPNPPLTADLQNHPPAESVASGGRMTRVLRRHSLATDTVADGSTLAGDASHLRPALETSSAPRTTPPLPPRSLGGPPDLPPRSLASGKAASSAALPHDPAVAAAPLALLRPPSPTEIATPRRASGSVPGPRNGHTLADPAVDAGVRAGPTDGGRPCSRSPSDHGGAILNGRGAEETESGACRSAGTERTDAEFSHVAAHDRPSTNGVGAGHARVAFAERASGEGLEAGRANRGPGAGESGPKGASCSLARQNTERGGYKRHPRAGDAAAGGATCGPSSEGTMPRDSKSCPSVGTTVAEDVRGRASNGGPSTGPSVQWSLSREMLSAPPASTVRSEAIQVRQHGAWVERLAAIPRLQTHLSFLTTVRVSHVQMNDDPRRFLVMVFRGTKHMADFLLDSRVRLRPLRLYKGDLPDGTATAPEPLVEVEEACRVHTGFLTLFEWITLESKRRVRPGQQLHDVVQRVLGGAEEGGAPKPPDRIICAGHSLGGALATLCAVWCKLVYPQADVECITIGSPRVGNKTFAELFNRTVLTSIRLVNDTDPIPRLPTGFLETIFRFKRDPYKHVKGLICLVPYSLDVREDAVYAVQAKPKKYPHSKAGGHSADTYVKNLHSVNSQTIRHHQVSSLVMPTHV